MHFPSTAKSFCRKTSLLSEVTYQIYYTKSLSIITIKSNGRRHF